MTSKRTLIVEGIVNLTDREMWVYGTSGELLRLRPMAPVILRSGKLPAHPEEGIYYAVDLDSRTYRVLESNPEYVGRIAIPTYFGSGHGTERIYKFSTPSGLEIRPITNGMGESGQILIEKNGNRYDSRTAYAV